MRRRTFPDLGGKAPTDVSVRACAGSQSHRGETRSENPDRVLHAMRGMYYFTALATCPAPRGPCSRTSQRSWSAPGSPTNVPPAALLFAGCPKNFSALMAATTR
jgi:hypothetical protein